MTNTRRNRLNATISGSPFNQRLVENDYLYDRNYQSIQPAMTEAPTYFPKDSSSYYTPPTALALLLPADNIIVPSVSFSQQESSSSYVGLQPSHPNLNVVMPPNRIMNYYDDTSASSSSPLSFISSLLCCSSRPLTHGFMCWQCIRTNELGILERFGQFQSILAPGFHWIPLWPWTQVATRISLRIQQLDIVCETKTQDAVFCEITITVLYHVMATYCYEAHYRLFDPVHLIQTSVMDTLRSSVAKTLTLDALFSPTQTLADTIKSVIYPRLLEYGYQVMDVMVTNIRPDDHVLRAWTDVHVAKRIRQSLLYKAEADKIQQIKAAEAHAEELYLSGVGIASQRKALAQGIKNTCISNTNHNSTTIIRENMVSMEDRDVMDVLLMTQYYDMLESISSSSIQNVEENQQGQSLFLSSDPSFVNTLREQLTHFAPCKIPDLLS